MDRDGKCIHIRIYRKISNKKSDICRLKSAWFDLILSSKSIIGFFKADSSRLFYMDWRARKDSAVLALLHPEKLFCYVIIITRQRLDVKCIKIAPGRMRPCSCHYLSSSATSTPLFWIFHTSDFAIKIFQGIILHNGKSNEILQNYIFNGLVGQRMLLPFFLSLEMAFIGGERDIRYSFIYSNNKTERESIHIFILLKQH